MNALSIIINIFVIGSGAEDFISISLGSVLNSLPLGLPIICMCNNLHVQQFAHAKHHACVFVTKAVMVF